MQIVYVYFRQQRSAGEYNHFAVEALGDHTASSPTGVAGCVADV